MAWVEIQPGFSFNFLLAKQFLRQENKRTNNTAEFQRKFITKGSTKLLNLPQSICQDIKDMFFWVRPAPSTFCARKYKLAEITGSNILATNTVIFIQTNCMEQLPPFNFLLLLLTAQLLFFM